MPHTSLRLEYIGDDNATIATEKDTRMLCERRRRYKETRNTLTRIPTSIFTATFSALSVAIGVCGL